MQALAELVVFNVATSDDLMAAGLHATTAVCTCQLAYMYISTMAFNVASDAGKISCENEKGTHQLQRPHLKQTCQWPVQAGI